MGTAMALDFENGGAEVTLDGSGLPQVDGQGRPPLPDTEVEPDRVNAITAAVLADQPEDITISGPPDGSVTLIAGYIDPSGNRFTSAEVRELRGRDEEALARALASGDITRYVDTIVRTGTIRIGELTEEVDAKEFAKALDSLLIGDRDLLTLQIRRLAYGDTMQLDVKCPWPECAAEFSVDYSFSADVPLRPWEQDDKSQRLFDIELPSGGVAEIKPLDGRAQKAVFTPENGKKTPAELNTLLLRELVVSIDGKAVKGVGPILDMASKDRVHLLEWVNDNQPGPRYDEVKQECPDCVREFPLVVSLRDMFRGA